MGTVTHAGHLARRASDRALELSQGHHALTFVLLVLQVASWVNRYQLGPKLALFFSSFLQGDRELSPHLSGQSLQDNQWPATGRGGASSCFRRPIGGH